MTLRWFAFVDSQNISAICRKFFTLKFSNEIFLFLLQNSVLEECGDMLHNIDKKSDGEIINLANDANFVLMNDISEGTSVDHSQLVTM